MPLRRQIRYLFEALFVLASYGLLWLLPLDLASTLGGCIGRKFGPRLKVDKIARRNLAMAFPEMTDAERDKVIDGMWDNLGRIAGEFAHIPRKKIMTRVKVEGLEHLKNISKENGAAIFISAHCANWELCPRSANAYGYPQTIIYRHANNPWVNWLIRTTRADYYRDMFAPGTSMARRLASAIKQGHHIGMLVDQKMNHGIAVPFFGRDAMTGTTAAQLALKFNLLLIPTQVIRTGGANFIVRVFPPYAPVNSGNVKQDIHQAMVQINAMLESWIREYPEQWFWVHNRWPK